MNKYDYYVFVGTYTKPTWLNSHEKNKFGSLRVFREATLKSEKTTGLPISDGIYSLEYNSSTGQLVHASSSKGHENPTFLTIHPNQKFFTLLEKIIFWKVER